MKTLVTLLLLTLICCLYHISAAPVAPHLLAQQCCPVCVRKPVPKGKVKNVTMTDSGCKLKAIVVTTVCDKKICMTGNWAWAKKLLTEFEQSAAKNASESAFNQAPCSKDLNKV
ncbi:C-C motif chemokine 19-like [Chelmon rostratus]|uniref:C-C motif chemokine 19-like n=1 Tax=Chelmon rostratus TaxID=109905 RepID=UPI001BE847DA|nr:C-C motif chemokine 19-like [Chelmon rostratus]